MYIVVLVPMHPMGWRKWVAIWERFWFYFVSPKSPKSIRIGSEPSQQLCSFLNAIQELHTWIFRSACSNLIFWQQPSCNSRTEQQPRWNFNTEQQPSLNFCYFASRTKDQHFLFNGHHIFTPLNFYIESQRFNFCNFENRKLSAIFSMVITIFAPLDIDID